MSLLQGQCPQGGGDVDWAQAVAGAGGRRGRATQGATVRCAGQPKRIGEVRTEQACAEAALHLAWALGPAQEGDRLGGADATPDRAIGPFADASLVSIPWRCGS